MNHCNLSFKAVEWINGELLGDGCITSDSLCSARFVYTSQYPEYIEYVANTLNAFGVKFNGKIRERKDERHHDYNYRSFAYMELVAFRTQWYPNGKKIVPRDIKLTPLTCRQWYIGDGCLHHYARKNSAIELATCGFSVPDVKWLIQELGEVGVLASRQPSRNIVHISSYSVGDFLKYIGTCPVKCYEYKWAQARLL